MTWKRALYTLRDRDLVPKSIMGDWLDTKPQLQSPFLDNAHKLEQRKRAQIRAFLDKHGAHLPDSERNELNALVPEFVGPPFPADPEHMPELHERMQKLKADAMAQLEAQKQSARQQLSELNAVDPQRSESKDTEAAAPALEAAQIEEIGRHIDSPAPADRQKMQDAFAELTKQQEKLEADWEKWSQQHGDPDNTTAKLKDMKQQREQARKQLGKINLYSAHLIGGKIIVDSHVAHKKRTKAQQRYADGQSIQDMDLAGADLSSLEFVDADISGSDLSGANLNGAVFHRCNLTDVILSRASIQDASFTDCELNGTNLGETQVERSSFSGSRLKKVILHKTEFSRCDFRQTQWQDVLNNMHARFSTCRFDASSADKTIFVQCHFENSSFYQARFSQTIFQQTTLVNVNFEQSQQKSAGFVACDMDTINFSQARLDGVSFIYKLKIRRCAFQETTLKGCSFKGTVLHGIQAQKARLQYCDLTLADLRNADFTGADMHHCVLKSADLRDSLFNQVDFTSAILTKADLRGADLRHANFCTADISEVRMDNTTLIQNIYTEHTKRYPLYRDSYAQQDAVRP
ncbi:pentapeptide repeat-containing protein [Advenella kashmirensis]|uniref:pentapeptide repeat-containing protein n=1 Tax=Advenella kashmirensis TaxID=310575 RepID=UPI001494F9BB|nr:pentapeptide repeat-containing protein [Advenella kashmirensis]